MPDTTNLVASPQVNGNLSNCQVNISVLNGSTRLNPFVQLDTG